MVVETRDPVDPAEVRELFSNIPGIVVKDDLDNFVYPMPLTASEQFDVEVGRIRRSLIFGEQGLEFFVCGDQILKGAALNAVQIGELMLKKN
jgi:aspartate-semialdehyde dehydrogenase